MPPRIADYGAYDWLRLRPLTHRYKTWQYRITNRIYGGYPPREGDLEALRATIRGRRVLITPAFSEPDLIEWQVRLIRHYVPGVLYVVIDNSPDDAGAAAVAASARRNDVPYLRLPQNPWYQPSRNHGIALNWIWRNVVRPAEPELFGFIDHDLFPTGPHDPFAALDSQDFFGVVRPSGHRWFLWAGFCMYRFAGVKDKPLDFSQDWFIGLDTGGGNWEVLYRHADRSKLREQETRFLPFREGLQMVDAPIQWCGPWLHEVGEMGQARYDLDKRRMLIETLTPHLELARAAQAAAPDKAPIRPR